MGSEVPAVPSGTQDTTPTSEADVLNDGVVDSGEDVVVSDDETKDETPDEDEGESTSSTSDEDEEDLAEPESEEDIEDKLTSEVDEPTRPSWQVIKDKYPELAKNKDFRELYFRDKAMTDVFPTVADAKEAAGKAEYLDVLDNVLVEGKIEQIFKNVDENVLAQLSDRLLPALYNTNKEFFKRATQPLIIDVLNNIYDQAERTDDDNLRRSVRNISRVLTGNPDIPKRLVPASTDPTVEAERNKLREERVNLFKRDERNFLNNADRIVATKLDKLVLDGLDPKKELTDFARQAVVEKTIADLKRTLISDQGLTNKLRQLHKLAARSGFPDEYRARIVTASLERARKLIPVLRNKHRLAALGKQPSTKGNENPKVIAKTEKVTTSNTSKVTRQNIDMKRTSAEDFLNDKITFRK